MPHYKSFHLLVGVCCVPKYSFSGVTVNIKKVNRLKLLVGQPQQIWIQTFDKDSILEWEGSGSVVEYLTRDREAAGSSLTCVTALWSLSKTHLS